MRKYYYKPYICLYCSKQFMGRTDKQCKYCNLDCARKGIWGKEKQTKEQKAARIRKWEHEVRRQAYDAYGGPMCQCCGTTIPEFLTFDHIEGGGSEHRKLDKTASGKMHMWLKRHGFPPGYRVLCFNCNVGAFRNGGECRCQSMKTSAPPT